MDLKQGMGLYHTSTLKIGKVVVNRLKRSASGMDHNINMDNVGLESLVRLLMEARLLSV